MRYRRCSPSELIAAAAALYTPALLPMLTPTQEHFLKKQLVEQQLAHETAALLTPAGLARFGPPFRQDAPQDPLEFPLLRFFFSRHVATFPFIAIKQLPERFWQDSVQAFYEAFAAKRILRSEDRGELSKRHQASAKMLRGVQLFATLVVATTLEQDYYKTLLPNLEDVAKVTKTAGSGEQLLVEELMRPVYVHGVHINVVGVKQVETTSGGWFGLQSSYHYEFLVAVQQQGGSLRYVYRRYHDWQALAKRLAKLFPGKELPPLPSKLKAEVSAEFEEKSAVVLHREDMRLALRGYLQELAKNPEVAASETFKQFLGAGLVDEASLSAEDRGDIARRQDIDRRRMQNRIDFLHATQTQVVLFKNDMVGLKKQILELESGLEDVFDEFGRARSVLQLHTPTLRLFVAYIKMEIALTIYEMFLGQDNSQAMFKHLRGLHRMLPYTLMAGVLRLTNPVRMMKGMIDLFMSPRVVPFSGGRSLMQMMFGNIITDDLKKLEEEEVQLEVKLRQHLGQSEEKAHRRLLSPRGLGSSTPQPPHGDDAGALVAKLRLYVWEEDEAVVALLKQRLVDSHEDLVLGVVEATELTNHVAVPAAVVQQLRLSHAAFERVYLKKEDTTGSEFGELLRQLELYSDVQLLLRLLIRIRDKELMAELWNEPQLTGLIKEIFALLYGPLIEIFRTANMVKAMRDTQYFLDDLFATVEELHTRMYFVAPHQMVQEIVLVIERHEDAFFCFTNDLYEADGDSFFKRMIGWVQVFARALRFKFVHPEQLLRLLELVDATAAVDPGLDAAGLAKELDGVVQQTLARRMAYLELLKEVLQGNNDGGMDDRMQVAWDQLNDILFAGMTPGEFGVDESDWAEMQMHVNPLGAGANDRQTQLLASLAETEVGVSPDLLERLREPFARVLHRYLDAVEQE